MKNKIPGVYGPFKHEHDIWSMEEDVFETITLNKDQIEQATEIANTRCCGKSHYDLRNNVTGAVGEIAVQQYLNAYKEIPYWGKVDEAYHEFGDRGYDLIWNDFKIDVKTSKSHLRDLKLFVSDPLCELYVLCKSFLIWKEETRVDLIGWIHRDSIRERIQVDNFLNEFVRWDDLWPMHLLTESDYTQNMKGKKHVTETTD